MNKVSLLVGAVQVGAAIEATCSGNWKTSVIWTCYAVAAFVLAFI